PRLNWSSPAGQEHVNDLSSPGRDGIESVSEEYARVVLVQDLVSRIEEQGIAYGYRCSSAAVVGVDRQGVDAFSVDHVPAICGVAIDQNPGDASHGDRVTGIVCFSEGEGNPLTGDLTLVGGHQSSPPSSSSSSSSSRPARAYRLS